jgi:hypothetical protein
MTMVLAMAIRTSALEQGRIDSALVLSVNAFTSFDAEEERAQCAGYAAVLCHPDFLHAVESGRHRRIAVTLFEWAPGVLRPAVNPWRLMESADDAPSWPKPSSKAPPFQRRLTSDLRLSKC